MSSSWGYDYSQLYPSHPSPWVRLELGWDTAETPVAGTNFISNAEETFAENTRIYKIGEEYGFPTGEYLLIENRQPVAYNRLLPQGGLAIYHIDENAELDTEGHPGQSNWPRNGRHYKVALVQADGKYDLEQSRNKGDDADFFHAGGVSELLPSTSGNGPYPNTDSYQSGRISQTEVSIYGVTESDIVMGFEFSHPTASVATVSPTRRPTQRPTNRPTLRPTSRPTQRPTQRPTNRPTPRPTSSPTLRGTPANTDAAVEPDLSVLAGLLGSPTQKPTLQPASTTAEASVEGDGSIIPDLSSLDELSGFGSIFGSAMENTLLVP